MQSVHKGHPTSQAPLRTFVIDKPAPDPVVPDDAGRALSAAPLLPSAFDRLQTSVGLGYVQGADWGAQWLASGAYGGRQVALDTLFTHGREGTRLDRGTFTLADPDAGWRIDAGDVFSLLSGASRGARATWRARGDRRPSLAWYGSRPGVTPRPSVVAYRDQIRFASQTLLDAEIASDKSALAATEWTFPHFSFAASWRDQRSPVRAIDRSLFAEVPVARGFAVGGSVVRSDVAGERGTWRSIFLRVPVSRWMRLTFERTFSESANITQALSAVSANVAAGRLQTFYRQHWGETTMNLAGVPESIERQQIQSMAAYNAGTRVQLTLQMATGWSPHGAAQHWEELQTSVRLTNHSTLQVVTAVPDFGNPERLRARFVQQLPRAFAVEAEFGRLSAFQSIPGELDRSRGRVMVSRTFDIATPSRGGRIDGSVVDHAGRPVAGARVLLGAYAGVSDADGHYTFLHLPRGTYELSLDTAFLPAAFAWDGRRQTLVVTPTSRSTASLLVAPLNAVHGRVYVDRNSNKQFDTGEGVEGIVVLLDDRAVATSADGAYSFYNVWPGAHLVHLDTARLPATFQPAAGVERPITLGDDAPVTGVEFPLTVIGKPIQWRGIGGGGRE
ncbi:MAG TPA: carboxypeptidase-like regulatory domain-containing protein [Vicinamibacterales bacterium]|nr:carboxypeptidase-like regulatory domain-containing protein [Vicinamibacterales bacterium]